MAPCPTDDTLGALVHHALPHDEVARVTAHLDGCDGCRQAVIAVVRGGGVVTVDLGSPKPAPKPIIKRIGRYELRKLLGSGGMGHVYEAYDAELARAIALKVLRPDLARASLAERLVRESRMMAKLAHPAVVAVYDVGRDDDMVYVAMELVRGETLAAHVARVAPGWRTIVALYERAGRGLAAAHAAGIVHRDFKPDNVLVELVAGRATRVAVSDFGIAVALAPADATSATGTLTAPGAAIGTPAYMAPEQLDGAAVDARADIFAFSVSLWEALFGERPFRATTVRELRVAMATPPRAPRGVPRRIVRALQRGLAVAPADRWPTLEAMLRELAAVLARRRRVALGLTALALVAVGVAGALVLHTPADACARGLAALDDLPHPVLADPALQAAASAKITATTAAWRTTFGATCTRDATPIQAAPIAACLDARRIELAGWLADLGVDDARHAVQLAGLVEDPAACAHPAPGLLASRVPEDPALRRRVSALRYRGFDIEGARDRGDFARALADAAALVRDAEPVWPQVHAEALYLLGTTQSMAGDSKPALATLQHTAAVAEAAHADYIAANAWIQLVLGATFDDGDPTRGLEYVTYAAAAVARVGDPPELQAMVDYVHGNTLVAADRDDEAEVVLRRAVELAKTKAPDILPQAIQGLGFLYEDRARYGDAIAAYRDALAHLPASGPAVVSSAVIFRQRLAINLSLAGHDDDALAMAREAVALADKTLPTDSIDRHFAHSALAQVLESHGDYAAALVEAHASGEAIGKLRGERDERYGEALDLEATLLGELARFTESAAMFARACEILAFTLGDGASAQLSCVLAQSSALAGLHRDAEALALLEKIVPTYEAMYPHGHPQLANALVARGIERGATGKHREARADLERALAMFGDPAELDPGHRAAAQFALAKELWPSTRAKSLLDDAIVRFGRSSPTWRSTLAEAVAWRSAKH